MKSLEKIKNVMYFLFWCFCSLLIHVSFSCMPDYYGDDCGVHCKVEGNIEKCDKSGAVCKEGENTLFIDFITKLSQKILKKDLF